MPGEQRKRERESDNASSLQSLSLYSIGGQDTVVAFDSQAGSELMLHFLLLSCLETELQSPSQITQRGIQTSRQSLPPQRPHPGEYESPEV